MTCVKTTEQLIDWLEGELPPEAAVEVEQHVAGCPSCARDVHEIRQTLAAMAQPVDEPGEAYFASFYPRLRQTLELDEAGRSWVRRWWDRFWAPIPWLRVGAGVAAAVAVTLGVLFVSGRVTINHAPKAQIARVHPTAPKKNGFLIARADPAFFQEVSTLRKDEVNELQVQIAKVMVGRIVSARLVALPGSRPTAPALDAPTTADLNDEELAEAVTTLTKDAKNWTL